MSKILLIEDNDAVRLGLEKTFSEENFQVLCANTGEIGLDKAERDLPDMIVLDIMLPGMSGFEVLKKLRDRRITIPLMLLTARDDDMDKILGLELGADDYVTKPFNPREVVARVKALLRRVEYQQKDENSDGPSLKSFDFGDVAVDFERHVVRKAGDDVSLTHREFRLLEYFIENRGKLITRDKLLEDVWEYDAYDTSYVTTRTVDNHILRLRKKLEDEPDHPRHIQTIRGYGYKFVVDAEN
ncbi:MAG: response regulator transcription factor [Calditrichia bacterium]|nr:response regulator transcription factor [Calditrichia bacterium]